MIRSGNTMKKHNPHSRKATADTSESQEKTGIKPSPLIHSEKGRHENGEKCVAECPLYGVKARRTG